MPAVADDDVADDDDVSRSLMIPQQTNCYHASWYLSNVAASFMFTPLTRNPVQFGVLRVSGQTLTI